MRLILGFIAISLATSASATARQSEWQDESPATARKVLRDFSDCSVRYEPEAARRFIMINQGERLAETDFRRLFDGRCLGFRGGRLSINPWRSRAALAEAFIRRQSKHRRAMTFSGVPALEWPVPPRRMPDAANDTATIARENATVETQRLLSMLGECVVRANPAGALSVLDSDIDSSKEASRFQALTPVIAGCVRKGQTLAFNRTNLRSALALSYFRLAANGTAGAQAGNGAR